MTYHITPTPTAFPQSRKYCFFTNQIAKKPTINKNKKPIGSKREGEGFTKYCKSPEIKPKIITKIVTFIAVL